MTTTRKLPPGIRYLKTSGKYQARYTVTRAGVSQQRSAGTFKTLTEAKDARAQALADLRSNTWVDPALSKQAFEQWATEWRDLVGRHDRRTDSFLRVHLLPQWGERRLEQLEPADVQRWVNALYASHLSHGSAAAVYALFKRMMRDAVDYDRLPKSPCRTVREPKGDAKPERESLSLEELARIEAAAPARYRAMVHLAAWTGMRWQECAALHWEDVNLEAGLIRVHRAVKADGQLGSTKNRKTREVVLPPSVVQALRDHRRDFGGAAKWQLEASPLVFTSARGRLLNYSYFSQRVWRPLVREAGLPEVTFHKLRHAYVGLMVQAGLDWKVLSAQVGHHSPSFTADQYGWRRSDYDKVIVEAVERMQETS